MRRKPTSSLHHHRQRETVTSFRRSAESRTWDTAGMQDCRTGRRQMTNWECAAATVQGEEVWSRSRRPRAWWWWCPGGSVGGGEPPSACKLWERIVQAAPACPEARHLLVSYDCITPLLDFEWKALCILIVLGAQWRWRTRRKERDDLNSFTQTLLLSVDKTCSPLARTTRPKGNLYFLSLPCFLSPFEGQKGPRRKTNGRATPVSKTINFFALENLLAKKNAPVLHCFFVLLCIRKSTRKKALNPKPFHCSFPSSSSSSSSPFWRFFFFSLFLFPYVGGNCTHLIYWQGQQHDFLRTSKRDLDKCSFLLQVPLKIWGRNLIPRDLPCNNPNEQFSLQLCPSFVIYNFSEPRKQWFWVALE